MAANEVARYIVNLCIEDGEPISNLQLQKILFFCQVESYKVNNSPLFSDDFEAWRYGPVVPSIYRLFSIFGGMRISRTVETTPESDEYMPGFVGAVVRRLRSLAPWDLVALTHKEGSPWDQIYNDGSGDGYVIPKQLIASMAHGNNLS